jgi:hypothetical protein
MFGSTIIEVAIGLIFIYFLMSMISSHINELIAQWMQWRSKDLDAAIRRMLADPELGNKVMNHPLITGLASRAGAKPAYIPPNTFALALFDAIAPAGDAPTALERVRDQVVKSLPQSRASQALLAIIDRANGDIERARAGTVEWFNAAMDRLSGAYKRRIQLLTLCVALVLTLLFGADTLAIADALFKEPTLRAAVTGAAQNASSTQVAPGAQSVGQIVEQLEKTGLPLGWGALPADALGWFKKVIGLLVTTLAVSLGAPFWFDVLRNVSNLRSSGPPPPK